MIYQKLLPGLAIFTCKSCRSWKKEWLNWLVSYKAISLGYRFFELNLAWNSLKAAWTSDLGRWWSLFQILHPASPLAGFVLGSPECNSSATLENYWVHTDSNWDYPIKRFWQAMNFPIASVTQTFLIGSSRNLSDEPKESLRGGYSKVRRIWRHCSVKKNIHECFIIAKINLILLYLETSFLVVRQVLMLKRPLQPY